MAWLSENLSCCRDALLLVFVPFSKPFHFFILQVSMQAYISFFLLLIPVRSMNWHCWSSMREYWSNDMHLFSVWPPMKLPVTKTHQKSVELFNINCADSGSRFLSNLFQEFFIFFTDYFFIGRNNMRPATAHSYTYVPVYLDLWI